MKTRLLFLYVPILALAMGYLALNQDNPSETSRFYYSRLRSRIIKAAETRQPLSSYSRASIPYRYRAKY